MGRHVRKLFLVFAVLSISLYLEAEKIAKPVKNIQISSPTFRTETQLASAFLDKKKMNLIYTERHTATYQDGKLQSSTNDYFDLQKTKIAELNADYSKSLVMPTYIFRDLRTGSVEGIRLEDQKYFIYRQERGKKEENHLLENIENVFSCQGWHYYLIANIDQIQNSPLQMKLIFPSKLDYYSFRIRPIERDESVLSLRLEFDSWLIRLFAPHLDITYNKSTKKIVQYYGPSNILDENGKIQNVHIFYEQPR
jgi:hypothetical protein